MQNKRDFNSKSACTQVKEGEELVAMMSSFKKAFDFLDDGTVDSSTGNETLKNKLASYDERCFKESKANLLHKLIRGNIAAMNMRRKKVIQTK